MMPKSVCLVIIFNHKYDKNISVLEEIYGNKFKNIYFLIPFYTGSNPRVIPVYESSFYFQGYIAQGIKTFYDSKFAHYLFIGDDLILNPAINESNYAQLLGLAPNASYLPELRLLDGSKEKGALSSTEELVPTYWSHTIKGVNFYDNRKGSETNLEIPSYDEAIRLFAEHGLEIKPLSYYNVFGKLMMPTSIRQAIETIRSFLTYYITWRNRKVPGNIQQLNLDYPLAYAYSDIVIVSSQAIKQFCHLCGVFSAMGLFVEMAIPTALILSGGSIVTDKDSRLKGQALWLDDIVGLEKKYNLDLGALLADFPQEQFYYHPVKLSRWR